jgi:lipopolysaccharide export system permease protein
VVVLATIVMTIILIRTLGQATKGTVNPSEVMLVMGLTVIGHLTTILTLSLFIAVVSTLSRMYADSEMVIWFSSGRGLTSFAPPLLRFAWPILLAIGLLALFVWPWSNQQIQDLRDRFEQRNDIERVAPGQFQESAGGNAYFSLTRTAPAIKQEGMCLFQV